VGSDLTTWVPQDYQQFPPIYYEIPSDYPYKNWFYDLNALWLTLGKNISESVIEHPEKHSFLPLDYPMIVPGGRFRESYYWDSYWIVRGLLVCNMNETAYYVIQNLLNDVANFGFVPNGERIYYLDRSQPPLLSEMVLSYYSYMLKQKEYLSNSGNQAFLNDFITSAYNLMQREYSFWMNETNGHVIVLSNPLNTSEFFSLNRYYSNYTSPRPESYLADWENSLQGTSRTSEQLNFFYQSTRGGAETGWDFSSRWIHQYYNLSFIDTIDIIPVELNAYLYRYELNLAKLSLLVTSINHGDPEQGETTANSYLNAALHRYQGIQLFLWDNSSYHWNDYNVSSSSFVYPFRTNYTSIAYWLPLWAGIYPTNNISQIIEMMKSYVKDEDKEFSSMAVSFPTAVVGNSASSLIDVLTANKLVNSLMNSQLIQNSGILTTNINTGQQWDSPNGKSSFSSDFCFIIVVLFLFFFVYFSLGSTCVAYD
jgi:alpha,alpha-trehalase